MEIRKSTLRIAGGVIGVMIIIALITIPTCIKQHRDKQRQAEIEMAIQRAIDKEYKSLLWDYEYYVKEALDYTNPNSSRKSAIQKINKIFGYQFYCKDSYSPVYDFEREYKQKNADAKKTLKALAGIKVMGGLLE